MLKKTIGLLASAAMLWLPWPAYLLTVVVLLWAFWEELGDLTLAAWDDYHLRRTGKALRTKKHHADVSGYYVHVLAMQNRVDRERKARWKAMRKRIFSWMGLFPGRTASSARNSVRREGIISLRLDGRD